MRLFVFQFQQGSIITSSLDTDVPNSVVSIPTRFNYNGFLLVKVLLPMRVSIPTRFNYNSDMMKYGAMPYMFQFQQGSIITKVFDGYVYFDGVSIPTRFNYNCS